MKCHSWSNHLTAADVSQRLITMLLFVDMLNAAETGISMHGSWSPWSACSVSCGVGISSRIRQCPTISDETVCQKSKGERECVQSSCHPENVGSPVVVFEGSMVTMRCPVSSLDDMISIYWVDPYGQILRYNAISDRYELHESVLYMRDVDPANAGLYHCVLSRSDSSLSTGDVQLEVRTCTDANPCHHGGTCLEIARPAVQSQQTRSTPRFRCSCVVGFAGVLCEQTMIYQPMVVIFGLIAGLLIALLVILVYCMCWKRRKHRPPYVALKTADEVVLQPSVNKFPAHDYVAGAVSHVDPLPIRPSKTLISNAGSTPQLRDSQVPLRPSTHGQMNAVAGFQTNVQPVPSRVSVPASRSTAPSGYRTVPHSQQDLPRVVSTTHELNLHQLPSTARPTAPPVSPDLQHDSQNPDTSAHPYSDDRLADDTRGRTESSPIKAVTTRSVGVSPLVMTSRSSTGSSVNKPSAAATVVAAAAVTLEQPTPSAPRSANSAIDGPSGKGVENPMTWHAIEAMWQKEPSLMAEKTKPSGTVTDHRAKHHVENVLSRVHYAQDDVDATNQSGLRQSSTGSRRRKTRSARTLARELSLERIWQRSATAAELSSRDLDSDAEKRRFRKLWSPRHQNQHRRSSPPRSRVPYQTNPSSRGRETHDEEAMLGVVTGSHYDRRHHYQQQQQEWPSPADHPSLPSTATSSWHATPTPQMQQRDMAVNRTVLPKTATHVQVSTMPSPVNAKLAGGEPIDDRNRHIIKGRQNPSGYVVHHQQKTTESQHHQSRMEPMVGLPPRYPAPVPEKHLPAHQPPKQPAKDHQNSISSRVNFIVAVPKTAFRDPAGKMPQTTLHSSRATGTVEDVNARTTNSQIHNAVGPLQSHHSSTQPNRFRSQGTSHEPTGPVGSASLIQTRSIHQPTSNDLPPKVSATKIASVKASSIDESQGQGTAPQRRLFSPAAGLADPGYRPIVTQDELNRHKIIASRQRNATKTASATSTTSAVGTVGAHHQLQQQQQRAITAVDSGRQNHLAVNTSLSSRPRVNQVLQNSPAASRKTSHEATSTAMMTSIAAERVNQPVADIRALFEHRSRQLSSKQPHEFYVNNSPVHGSGADTDWETVAETDMERAGGGNYGYHRTPIMGSSLASPRSSKRRRDFVPGTFTWVRPPSGGWSSKSPRHWHVRTSPPVPRTSTPLQASNMRRKKN